MPRIFRAQVRKPRDPRAEQSPAEYRGKWKRISRIYRQRNPFCRFCAEQGRITFAAVVDHKYPVSDGGPMYPGPDGLQPLCTAHHALKSRLEDHARKTGQMHRIVQWCDEPETRPRFRGEFA